MNGLISVIVPVFNTGDNLRKCVNSILKSTYKNIEILLIDDGSDSYTAKLCDQIESENNLVKTIHKINGGVSSARNCGLDNAQGDFIAFVDSDDLVHKNMFETLINKISNENADIAVCGYRECYSDKTFKSYKKPNKILANNKDILDDFFITNNIGWNIWAKLYKRNKVENIRKQTDRLVFTEEVLYDYQKSGESAMSDQNVLKFMDTFELINKVFDDKETDELFINEKNAFYIKNCLWFFRFMNVKDKSDFLKIEIKEKKNIFLKNINNNNINISLKTKFELFLFKYFPLFFKITSLMWGGGQNIFRYKTKEL